jgi:curli biogenesis system outer membrane secretion channel CsgG
MSGLFSRCFGCVAVALALSSGVARGQESTAKKRVAVLNFDNPSISADAPSGLFGADGVDVGKGVSILLIEKLVQGGKYTVVDRSALEKLLKEQSNPEGERVDAYGMAAKIGRMLGLDAMIIGGVTQYGPDDRHADAKAAGGQFAGGVRVRKSKAYVGITAQVLDMSTAKVIADFAATGESTQAGGITVIGGKGKSKSSTEMLGSEFAGSLLPEATRDAVGKIAEKLNAFAGRIPRLQTQPQGDAAKLPGTPPCEHFRCADYWVFLPDFRRTMSAEGVPRARTSVLPSPDHVPPKMSSEVNWVSCFGAPLGRG